MDTTATREDLYSFYSDQFKDRNGIRPRWAAHWSYQELSDALEHMFEADREPEMPTSGDGWAYQGSPEGLADWD